VSGKNIPHTSCKLATARVPGLSPDYLANRADKKLRGHLGKKLHGNREIVTEQEVGKWAPRAW